MLVVDSLDGRLLDEESTVYGEVALPHLRALAAESVNFVRAYSPNPVCVPARTAILTGRDPHWLNVYSNSDGLAAAEDGTLDARCLRLHGTSWCERLRSAQAGVVTLPAAMAQRGYEVRTFGKFDVGGTCTSNVPCDPANNESVWNGFHVNPKEHWCTLVRAADIRRAQNSLPKPKPGDYTHGEDYVRDSDTVSNCVRALHQYQHARQRRRSLAVAGGSGLKKDAAGDRRPLFLYCDVDYPHAPFWSDMPAEAVADANRSALGAPETLPLARMHPYDAAMSVARGMQHPPPTAEHAAAYRLAHFAKLAQTDRFIGRIVDAAEHMAHHTLLVLTSDHGEMRLEHAMWQKASLYEASGRVALLLRPPGGVSAARRRASRVMRVTSTTSLMPTLLHAAETTVGALARGERLEAPRGIMRGIGGTGRGGGGGGGGSGGSEGEAGRAASLLPLLSTDVHPAELALEAGAAVAQYHGPTGPTAACMLRVGRWKLLEYGALLGAPDAWPPQLFDVEADPAEVRDVARSAPRGLLASLQQQLRARLDCAAADAAAKRHDHELFELQERPGLNGTRACFATDLEPRDLRRLHAWRREAALAFGSTPPPANQLEAGGTRAPPDLGPILLK